LGGSGSDGNTRISVDSLGNTYILGRTDSTNFPTINSIYGTYSGGIDIFLAKINETTPQGYSITGRVTDLCGRPLSGISINLDGTVNTTTNASGYYAMQNINASNYLLTPSLPGYIFTPASRTVSVVTHVAAQDFVGRTGQTCFNETELEQAVIAERNKWDVKSDGKIGLEEVIRALQIITGLRPQ
jgi:hypothetical protein